MDCTLHNEKKTYISCLKKVYAKDFVLPKHEMLTQLLKTDQYQSVALVVPERCDKNRIQTYWQKWCQDMSVSGFPS